MEKLDKYSVSDLEKIVLKLRNMSYMPRQWRKSRIAIIKAEIKRRKESA